MAATHWLLSASRITPASLWKLPRTRTGSAIRSYMMAKTWLWLQLWLSIKPNLKCTQFGKYKKEYEEKIAIAEANIDKAVADCSAVVEIHTKLSAEKNELVLALASGGSAVQVIHQDTFSLT